MESKIVYFDKPGPGNTEEVLRIAKKRAQELGIKVAVVATTRGEVGVRATEILGDMKVVLVTHPTGVKGTDQQELTEENRRKIGVNGGIILTTTPLFHGIDYSMEKKLHMRLNVIPVSFALRLFGEGICVAIEISVMAADAGLVGTNEDLISIAGTGKGADSAIVVKPVHAQDFFELQVKEILCKPRQWTGKIEIDTIE